MGSAAPAPRRDTRLFAEAGDEQRGDRYVRSVLQLLAIFRFLSFALGAGLVFVVNATPEPALSRIATMVVVGVYNAARVVRPFNPTASSRWINGVTVTSDVAGSVALVLVTGGLDSAFLVFSLAPVITVALLLDLRSSIAVAAASSLSITGAYIAGGVGLREYPWILSGNYLVFALLYSVVCLAVAALPFFANLNWRRRERFESTDAERRRLRREVHDNIAQTLAFLSLKVKRAEQRSAEAGQGFTARDVQEIAHAVERAYLSVRDYLDGTEEVAVEMGTFPERLIEAVSQWRRETGLWADVIVEEDGPPVPSRVQRQLVQIMREALANVAKHAAAQRVTVTWRGGADRSVLRIKDDGRGFSGVSRGHGMNIMDERAEMVGAQVAVRSRPGEGTEVVATCANQEMEGDGDAD